MMQFSVIGQWLIDGKSPHTGQPVLETCRIVKNTFLFDEPNYPASVRQDSVGGRCLYEVGKTYAIQPGRGQKAIGRTPPIESIRRQDVREMTHDDAIARGFCSVLDYLQVWVEMHDKRAHGYLLCDLRRRDYADARGWQIDHGNEWRHYLDGRTPENYDAWVIRFAAASDQGGSEERWVRQVSNGVHTR